jgi:hypothetical protein
MLSIMKRTNYFNIAIVVFIVIALLAVGYYAYTKDNASGMKTYANAAYGVSFTYPNTYTIEEASTTGAQEGEIVTLTPKGTVVPANGENPSAMTVGMYKGLGARASSSDPTLQWVKTSPYSNFDLSKVDPGATTIGNKPGLLYTWDGLYSGTTVVTTHNGNIIAFSVTYDGNSDLQLRQDFTSLVESVQFTEAGTTTPVRAK